MMATVRCIVTVRVNLFNTLALCAEHLKADNADNITEFGHFKNYCYHGT